MSSIDEYEKIRASRKQNHKSSIPERYDPDEEDIRERKFNESLNSKKPQKSKKELLQEEEANFFKCTIRLFGRGTTIKIRWSVIGVWATITELERDPILGYRKPLMDAIYCISNDFPRDKATTGISGFITDKMNQEILDIVEVHEFIDNATIRCEHILQVIWGTLDNNVGDDEQF